MRITNRHLLNSLLTLSHDTKFIKSLPTQIKLFQHFVTWTGLSVFFWVDNQHHNSFVCWRNSLYGLHMLWAIVKFVLLANSACSSSGFTVGLKPTQTTGVEHEVNNPISKQTTLLKIISIHNKQIKLKSWWKAYAPPRGVTGVRK